jgi:hypothetical protein
LEQRKRVRILEDRFLIGKSSYGAIWNKGKGILGLFGLEGMIQGMGISLTRWLGIAKFSVWLVGFDVAGDSQCLVWLEG